MFDLDTWIISDTHFGHDNIIKFCNRPQNHEGIMLERWNSVVSKEDVVLHLGDLSYRGDKERSFHALSWLPGKKNFVWGNHDKQSEAWYGRTGFQQVGSLLGTFVEKDVTREGEPYTNTVKNWGFYQQFGSMRVLFSHYPDMWLKDWDLNIHGHIHNNPYSPKITDLSVYRNVSVEVRDYTPVRLGDLLDNA